MAGHFEHGNVHRKPNGERDWILGAFLPEGSLFYNRDFEINWSRLKKGDKKAGVSVNERATTFSVLAYGRHRIDFPGRESVVLAQEGDYVLFGPGIAHTWETLEDSLLVTIRWPSIPTDQSPAHPA